MKKSMLSFLLILLVLAISACSSQTSSSTVKSQNSIVPAIASTQIETAEPIATETTNPEPREINKKPVKRKTVSNEKNIKNAVKSDEKTSTKSVSSAKEKVSVEVKNTQKISGKNTTKASKKKAKSSPKPKKKKQSAKKAKPKPTPKTSATIPSAPDVEAKVAKYINEYRADKGVSTATVLSGLTRVARRRSEQLITNFAHTSGKDVCTDLKYGEFVDMTKHGLSESQSYYRGYNREAIAKGDWSGTADEIAKKIATGFKNSSSHWKYLSSNDYPYFAVGCTYNKSSDTWFCCICVSSENYG